MWLKAHNLARTQLPLQHRAGIPPCCTHQPVLAQLGQPRLIHVAVDVVAGSEVLPVRCAGEEGEGRKVRPCRPEGLGCVGVLRTARAVRDYGQRGAHCYWALLAAACAFASATACP